MALVYKVTLNQFLFGKTLRNKGYIYLGFMVLTLIDQKYSSTGQGHPLAEPYHLKHFLLQGNQFRPNAELAAALKFSQRGMLAPEALWAIKSVM